MSKRSKQQTMYQPSSQLKRRAPSGKPAGGKSAANKTTSRPVSKQGSAGTARSFSRTPADAPRQAAPTNLLTVRIAAIVVALAAVIGGTAWALSMKGSYATAEIIGLIVLGFVAGISIAVALRTEEIVIRLAKYLRR